MKPQVLSSGTLTGDEIVDDEGEKLGTLKDLMLELTSGQIAYAVLARGGIAGMGEKLFAVPWQLVTVDGENERLVAAIDAETLDNSPGFDPDNWPSFSDTTWQEGLHRHYGIEPSWVSPPLT